MPYDLNSAAARLRDKHANPLAFRHTMLDLLFATGCSVSEQAVALEGGDAMCVRASGPSAPSLQSPLVVVVVDLDPPHLGHVAREISRQARWPAHLASLGGPSVAVTWATALHALVSAPGQRPWVALYFRGPAHGLGAYVRATLAGLPEAAEVVQAVPSVLEVDDSGSGPFDLARLDLVRSRNVWRFPACDHTYSLSVAGRWHDSLTTLRELLDTLETGNSWTLHDVHLYQAQGAHLAAVLRTSAAVAFEHDDVTLVQLEGEQRLMFPINDALAGLQVLTETVPAAWRQELKRPLHMHVLPDGLRLYFRVPTGAKVVDLPDRAATLHCAWQIEPLAVVPTLAVLPLAIGNTERVGPVPPGVMVQGAVVWQTPALQDDEDIVGLLRAIAHNVAPI